MPPLVVRSLHRVSFGGDLPPASPFSLRQGGSPTLSPSQGPEVASLLGPEPNPSAESGGPDREEEEDCWHGGSGGSSQPASSDESEGASSEDTGANSWQLWVSRRSRRAATGAAAALRLALGSGECEDGSRQTRQAELEELRVLVRQRDLLHQQVQEKRRKLGLRSEALDVQAAQSSGQRWSNGHLAGEDLERWMAESLRRNIVTGSRILFVVNTAMFGARLVFHLLRSVACGSLRLQEELPTLWEGLALAVLTSLLAACIRWPLALLYYPTLAAYLVFVLAHGFHPLAPTCEELHILWRCAPRLERCRLAGFTFMQLMVTWILLTPWFIPRLELMHGLWAVIWLTFLAPVFLQERTDAVSYHQKVDIIWSVLFLSSINLIAIIKKQYLENTRQETFVLDLREGELSRKMFELLGYMVPQHLIVQMLKEPGKVIARQIDKASVLFIIFADFDQKAKVMSPQQLLEFLNRNFTEFDRICAMHQVTKIETVGEEYVCAVGVVPEDEAHAADTKRGGHRKILGRLLNVACDILDLQQDSEVAGSQVLFKMGIHTGPLVAGVTSQKLPRYRLFGDTMNTAARFMQRGLPGELQFGEATFHELPEGVQTKCRGEIELKGKGQVKVYLLQRKDQNLERQDAGSWHAPIAAERSSSGCLQRSRSLLPQHPHRVRGALARLLGRLNGAAAYSTGMTGKLSKEFEEVLLEMRITSAADLEAKPEKAMSGRRLCRNLWRVATPGWKDFPVGSEDNFLEWYLDECIAKDLDRRIAFQLLFIGTITLVEVSLLLLDVNAASVDWTRGSPIELSELGEYLLLRLVSALVILAYWASYRCLPSLRLRPRAALNGLLISICAVAGLVSCSYFYLPEDERPPSRQRLRVPSYSTVSFVQLMCVPVYTLVTTSYPMLFMPSCVFVLLAAFLMMLQTLVVQADYTIFSELAMFSFVLTSAVHAFGSWNEETLLRKRYVTKQAMEVTRTRMESILNQLMPPLVVEELRSTPLYVAPPSHRYLRATIVQSDLVGFTALASTRKPAEVLEFIGDLFGRFDYLTDLHEVYKVETVGDAYIAAQAEVPLTARNSPLSVVLLGLDMVEAASKWSMERGENVTCRVGVHTGECVGGIIGSEMQRYHLFGKLMAQVEVLEATAPAACVQVSGACRDAVEADILTRSRLSRDGFEFEPVGQDTLYTSKGEAHACEEVGGPTFLVRSTPEFREQAVRAGPASDAESC